MLKNLLQTNYKNNGFITLVSKINVEFIKILYTYRKINQG